MKRTVVIKYRSVISRIFTFLMSFEKPLVKSNCNSRRIKRTFLSYTWGGQWSHFARNHRFYVFSKWKTGKVLSPLFLKHLKGTKSTFKRTCGTDPPHISPTEGFSLLHQWTYCPSQPWSVEKVVRIRHVKPFVIFRFL